MDKRNSHCRNLCLNRNMCKNLKTHYLLFYNIMLIVSCSNVMLESTTKPEMILKNFTYPLEIENNELAGI